MRTVTVLFGQTLADIAVQEYGKLEAVCDIAKENALSITDTLPDGVVLKLPDIVYDKKIQEYFKQKRIKPATDLTEACSGIFTKEFTTEFK